MDLDSVEQDHIAALLDNSGEDPAEEDTALSSPEAGSEVIAISSKPPVTPAMSRETGATEKNGTNDVDNISAPTTIQSVATLPLDPSSGPGPSDQTQSDATAFNGDASVQAVDDAGSAAVSTPEKTNTGSAHLLSSSDHLPAHEETAANRDSTTNCPEDATEKTITQASATMYSPKSVEDDAGGAKEGGEPKDVDEKELGSAQDISTSHEISGPLKDLGETESNVTGTISLLSARNQDMVLDPDTTRSDVLPQVHHDDTRKTEAVIELPHHPKPTSEGAQLRIEDSQLYSEKAKSPEVQIMNQGIQHHAEMASVNGKHDQSSDKKTHASVPVSHDDEQTKTASLQRDDPPAPTNPHLQQTLLDLILRNANGRGALTKENLRDVTTKVGYALKEEQCQKIMQFLKEARVEMEEKGIDIGRLCSGGAPVGTALSSGIRSLNEAVAGEKRLQDNTQPAQTQSSHASASDLKTIDVPLPPSTPLPSTLTSERTVTSPPAPAPAPTAPRAMRTNKMLNAIESFLSNKSALLAATLNPTSTNDSSQIASSPGLPARVKMDVPMVDNSLVAKPMHSISQQNSSSLSQGHGSKSRDPAPIQDPRKSSTGYENQVGISIPLDPQIFSYTSSNKERANTNGKNEISLTGQGSLNSDTRPLKRKLSRSPPPSGYSTGRVSLAPHGYRPRRSSSASRSSPPPRGSNRSPDRGRKSLEIDRKAFYPSRDSKEVQRPMSPSQSPSRPYHSPWKKPYSTRGSPQPKGKVYAPSQRMLRSRSPSGPPSGRYGSYDLSRRSPSSIVGRRSPSPARSSRSYNRPRSRSRNGRSPSPRGYTAWSTRRGSGVYDHTPPRMDEAYDRHRRPSYEGSYDLERINKRPRPADAGSTGTRSPSPSTSRFVKPSMRYQVAHPGSSLISNNAPSSPAERRGAPPHHYHSTDALPEPSYRHLDHSPARPEGRRMSLSVRSPEASKRQSTAPMEGMLEAQTAFGAPSLPREPSFSLSYPVPGLWSARVGHRHASIVRIDLTIDEPTAAYWHIPPRDQWEPPELGPSVQLSLLCLPTGAVQEKQSSWGPHSTRQSMVDDLVSIPIAWPRMGTLLVQVNKDEPWGRAWLPYELADSTPSLDISLHLRQGNNTVTFIQLDNLTDCTFILAASICHRTKHPESFITLDNFLAEVNHQLSAGTSSAPEDANIAHESGIRVLRSSVVAQ
jgi:hypothetical protein